MKKEEKKDFEMGEHIKPSTELGKKVYEEEGYIYGVDFKNGTKFFFKSFPNENGKWYLPKAAEDVIINSIIRRSMQKEE